MREGSTSEGERKPVCSLIITCLWGFAVTKLVALELSELDEKFMGIGKLKHEKARFQSLMRAP